jgi:DNA-binding NarL/FixJ family response regulator
MTPNRSNVVLVVDDSPDTVRLLTDVLQGAGMKVIVATDGMAALRLATTHRPDIILMDAVMPVMDGFETCRQLKKLSDFDSAPVIFMTGLGEPEDSLRGFEAGGVDYVTKPIIIDDMLARMRVHVDNARKIKMARRALDAADQFLVATNREGGILWFTPHAYRLLQERFGAADSGELVLSNDVLKWLRARLLATSPAGPPWNETVFSDRGFKSRITFVGEGDSGEILFRISDASPREELAAVRTHFNLTPRETEVLSWIAKGKSNPDIAAILALSPRTIEKHLQVIFAKLGVANRTAATALILNFPRAAAGGGAANPGRDR